MGSDQIKLLIFIILLLIYAYLLLLKYYFYQVFIILTNFPKVNRDEAVKSPRTVIPALNLRYSEQRTGICSQLVLLDSRSLLRVSQIQCGNDNLRNFRLFTASSVLSSLRKLPHRHMSTTTFDQTGPSGTFDIRNAAHGENRRVTVPKFRRTCRLRESRRSDFQRQFAFCHRILGSPQPFLRSFSPYPDHRRSRCHRLPI